MRCSAISNRSVPFCCIHTRKELWNLSTTGESEQGDNSRITMLLNDVILDVHE